VASTACNMRFCEMAALPPQTILCEFARYHPAGAFVEAATSQSRWDVICHAARAQWTMKQKIERYTKYKSSDRK